MQAKAKIIERLRDFYRRAGISLYLLGSLLFYFSLHYTDSFWGVCLLILGLLLAVSDPLILMSKKREDSSLSPRDSLRDFYRAWLLGLIAAVFYLLRFFIELPLDKLGGPEASFLGRLRLLLLFFFLIFFIASLLYRLMLTLSDSSSLGFPALGLRSQRQQYLKRAIASILAFFSILVLLNYLSYLRNPSLDLSPGYYSFRENSRAVIRSLESEVNVYAFLPEIQAVRLRQGGFSPPELYKITSDVRVLLEQLSSINTKIKLNFYNADIDSYDSNEFGNINNGTLVFRSLKKESRDLSLEDKPYVERKVYVNNVDDLRKLEKNITKALVYVASPQKKIYFTASNGERYGLSGAASRTSGIESFKQQLRFYNLKLEKLDLKAGWPGKPLPQDADALAIIGPTVPFSKDAQAEIRAYLQKGGALFVAIDSQPGAENFDWLLGAVGTEKQNFVNAILTNTNFSGLLVSDNFQEHSVTDSIKKIPSASVLMPQQGYFEKLEQKKDKASSPSFRQAKEKDREAEAVDKKKKKERVPQKKQPIKDLGELESQVLLYSPYNSYVDLNRNGRRDAKEKAARRVLALAYEKENFPGSPRLIVFSGTNWLSERGIRFPLSNYNPLFAADSMFWLLESPLTATFTPLQRPTHNVQVTEELKWKLILFGMFVFPISVALALGFALFYYRRKFVRPFL